ncbi:MAG: peptide chain release factor N(5)-glutamine methyltransferase [Bacteroidota bacterium]
MNAHLQSNRVGDARAAAVSRLMQIGESEREANTQVKMLFECLFGFTSSDLVLKVNACFSESELLQLHKALNRLEQNEPIQYVLGHAFFFGMKFNVSRHILIPRPETEELVQWILDAELKRDLVLLDVGTGSGIIPVAVKKNRPEWKCMGMDVSVSALNIAKLNAQDLQAEIEWLQGDALGELPFPQVDILVSNPPYIPFEEKESMDKKVTQHEPELALFVEDQDPLIFYKAILNQALQMNPIPVVYFELHERYAEATSEMAVEKGFTVELKKDAQGKNRMLRCEGK